MSEKRTAAACHEAGHAVAGILVGRAFATVSIHYDAAIDSEGVCDFASVDGLIDAPLNDGIYSSDDLDPLVTPIVVTILAGKADEQLLGIDMTMDEFLKDRSDDARQVSMILDTAPYIENHDTHCERFWETTWALMGVPAAVTAIHAVAAQLIEREELTFDDVLQISGLEFTPWNIGEYTYTTRQIPMQ